MSNQEKKTVLFSEAVRHADYKFIQSFKGGDYKTALELVAHINWQNADAPLEKIFESYKHSQCVPLQWVDSFLELVSATPSVEKVHERLFYSAVNAQRWDVVSLLIEQEKASQDLQINCLSMLAEDITRPGIILDQFAVVKFAHLSLLKGRFDTKRMEDELAEKTHQVDKLTRMVDDLSRRLDAVENPQLRVINKAKPSLGGAQT